MGTVVGCGPWVDSSPRRHIAQGLLGGTHSELGHLSPRAGGRCRVADAGNMQWRASLNPGHSPFHPALCVRKESRGENVDVANPDGVPGSSLPSGPALTVAAVWEVNQRVKDLFLSATLPFK